MADSPPESWGSSITPALNMTLIGQLASSGTIGRFTASSLIKLKPECIIIPVSDEDTPLSAGTAKITFRMPYAFTLLTSPLGVRGMVKTAATGGTLLTVDINEGGVSILSTKLTFNAGSKTTVGASTPAVISDTSLADDAEMAIDIDNVGSTIAGTGLKIALIGYQT